MNLRVTAVLLVLVAVLAGGLYLARPRPDDPQAVATRLLDHYSLGQATRLRWQLRGQAPIELQRTAAGFVLSEPLRGEPVSQGRLQAILAAYDANVQEAFGDRPITDDLLQRAGLQPPLATFHAWFQDGRDIEVELGSQGGFGSDIYLRRAGRIYTGGEALYSSLQGHVEDFRDHLVFRNQAGTVRELAVEHPLPTGRRERLVLRRDQNGFRQVQPVEIRTDPAAAVTFVRVLMGLRIDNFMPTPMRLPERPADIVVDVDGEFGKEHVELWRDEASGHYGAHLQGRDVDVQIHGDQIGDLFEGVLARLRARWLLPVALPRPGHDDVDLARDVLRVLIDPGPGQPRIRVERRPNDVGFRLAEPVDAAVDDTAAAELLQALNNCRVLQFVDGAASEPRFGLGGDCLQLGVQGVGDQAMTMLKIGNDAVLGEADVSYAIRADEPGQVVAIPQPVHRQLQRHWSEYVRRKVFTPPLPAVTRLVLQRGDQQLVFTADGGRWFRDDATPAAQRLPNDDVAELVDELRDLRAQEVSRRDPEREPDWTLSLERSGGDVIARLAVLERGREQPLWLQPGSEPELLYQPKRRVGEALWALRALFDR